MGALRRLAVLLLIMLAPACVSAQTPAAQLQTPTGYVFAITYKPGPAWRPGAPMNRQALGPHAAYWTRLAREGRAIGAGPYLDIDGGMALILAANIEEARAVVAGDPAVTSGVFVGEVHAWSPRIRGPGELPRSGSHRSDGPN